MKPITHHPPPTTRFYQLTHDYLVPSLRDWLTRKQKETRRGRAEIRLAERSASWNAKPEKRQLPALWEFLNIIGWTRRGHWTESQRKMMRRATRYHAIRGGVFAVLVALVAMASFQFRDWRNAPDLAERVMDAKIGDVPELLHEYARHRRWADPILKAAIGTEPFDSKKKLNAALAFLPIDAAQTDYLCERLFVATPQELPVIRDVLFTSAHRATVVEALKDAVAEPDAKLSREQAESIARRRANCALALVKFGVDQTATLARNGPDPRCRTQLIHRARILGFDQLVRHLEKKEADATVRQAWILGLGEFPLDEVPPASKAACVKQLVGLYRDDADSGVHSAAEWVLRKWGPSSKVDEIESQFAGKAPPSGQNWYVNGQRQTMMIVREPQEFAMGSPADEEGRYGGRSGELEHQFTSRIGRTYAIAAKEVTVEQFLKFDSKHAYNQAYSPEANCPINGITWYDAARYCNWLSQKDNLSDGDLCYVSDPSSPGGIAPAADYLSRRGYRLPTETEWEYACRAQTQTSRHFGETTEYLDRYACYSGNSHDRMLPVGSLAPNAFGLFDMYGNAMEWCQERLKDYPTMAAGQASPDVEDRSEFRDDKPRAVRGGAFNNAASFMRSAWRSGNQPGKSAVNGSIGFRPARTWP